MWRPSTLAVALRARHGIARSRLPALAILLRLLLSAGPASADDVKVLCSNGFREVMQELAPAFERATSNTVAVTYDLSANLAKRIESDDRFDLAILTPALIDDLTAKGRLTGGGTTLARSAISFAIRTGRPKPDISSPDAVTQTLRTAGTLAYAGEGASAGYFLDLLKRLNLADAVAARVRTFPSGLAVAEAVARGEVDLGVMPVSEILPRAGIESAGLLPPGVRGYITMTAGVSTRASAGAATRELIAFLTSAAGDSVLERRGMERPR